MSREPGRSLPDLEPEELRRYARHLALPELGRKGQRKLKGARVLVVGLGGLGSPVGLYLAAAGVGTLGLLDDDVVAISNLQRQVLYGETDLGRRKTEAAQMRLHELNPHLDLEIHSVRLQADNAMEILARYDVIVDGTDNFPARYLLNDACVRLSKPNVYGAVSGFEGQLSVFWAPRGPCLRCLFPEPPPPGLVPTCAEAGVLGAVPGIVGSLQALETVKIITGAGEPLLGRFLALDGLRMRIREVKVPRSSSCPVCSEGSIHPPLTDYELLCGGDLSVDQRISSKELHRWRAEGRPFTLLDIRPRFEAADRPLLDAVAIPAEDLDLRFHELAEDTPIVVCCRLGFRSRAAAKKLRDHGFEHVLVLEGGIEALS